MRIALCDDDLKHSQYLETNLKQICNTDIEFAIFEDGESLIEEYEAGLGNFDVIFLDVEMKALNGVDTANKIREFDEYVIIIFVTNYDHYARQCFDCEAFRYLKKPVEKEKLIELYKLIRRKIDKGEKTISFKTGKRCVRLYQRDVIYLESDKHNIRLYTRDSEYRYRSKIEEEMKKLDPECFCQIHGSYIINLRYYKDRTNDTFILHGVDKELSVSRPYKKYILKRMEIFKMGEYEL